MEVKKILKISDKEFFTQIQNSVLLDIENSTGEKIELKEIKKGFEYKKAINNKLGSKDNVKVEILSFEEPKSYSAKIFGTQGINKIEYKIVSLKEDEIEVFYTEEFISDSKLKSINHKIMQVLYKKSSIKKSNRLLDSIESYVIQNRENTTSEN